MMTRLFCVFGVLLLAMALLAPAADDKPPTRFEVYTLKSPISESVEQVVRQLAGPDGQVTVDPPYRLVVVATEEGHRRIAEALQKMDRPPVNIRLTVRFAQAGQQRASDVSVSGEGEIIREEGITKTKIRVKPRIQDETTTYSDQAAQTLLVASGRDGYIAVGQEIPYLAWIMDYGRQLGIIEAAFEWRAVGAYLVAQPEVAGDGPLIRVRLIPELRGLDTQGRPRVIRFTSVATEVVVRDGQTFPLGGWDRDAQFYSRFLVGHGRDGSTETLQISLTAEIIRP
jgi:type II secretory pathway component GspD/PulD (secretin)